MGRFTQGEKLRFAGNKDQFIFNSKLSGTLDEAAKNTDKAEKKLAVRRSSNLPTKAKRAGSLSRSTRQRNLLAIQRTKKNCKAQEMALKKKKQNAAKKLDTKKLVFWRFLFTCC